MHPEAHLVEIQRRYQGAHKRLDELIALYRGKNAGWPHWCFAIREATIDCCQAALQSDPITAENFSEHQLAMTAAHALLAWRPGKGVYKINSVLQSALWSTPINGDIPIEALNTLPEWCPYVALDPSQDGLIGFWARHDLALGEHEMLWVLDYGDRLHTQSLNLGLTQNLKDAITATIDSDRHALESAFPGVEINVTSLPQSTVEGLLNLTLYLCSRAEVRPASPSAEKVGQPQNPEPTKTRHGARIYPPDKPRVWEVGWRTGPALEAALARSSEWQGGAHSGPRPHLRRAHWHSYWTGKGRTQLELRWLHPVLVAQVKGGDPGEGPVVVREVADK